MDAVVDEVEKNPIVLIHRRNEFYRIKLLQILAVFILSLLVNGFLIGIIDYLVKHPTAPVYFPADSVGRMIQEVPLTTLNMSPQDLVSWTIEAVQKAYSYDYLNFHAQFQDAEKYFTDYGWRNYMKGLEASNNLLSLSQYKFVVIAKAIQPPVLKSQGILNGAASFKFEMPILVTYWRPPYDNDEKSKIENALVVTVIVTRQSVLQSYKGLGLLQLNAVMQ